MWSCGDYLPLDQSRAEFLERSWIEKISKRVKEKKREKGKQIRKRETLERRRERVSAQTSANATREATEERERERERDEREASIHEEDEVVGTIPATGKYERAPLEW